MPRRTPDTPRGIRRLRCAKRGCRHRAHAAWPIGARGRVLTPIGRCHDVAITRLVLRFLGDPHRRTLATDARRVGSGPCR